MCDHLIIARARARAERIGSTAQTARGLVRVLTTTAAAWQLSPRPWPPQRPPRSRRLPAGGRLAARRPGLSPDIREIRRAIADPLYRRSVLARLRREEARLLAPPPRTAAAVTAWAVATEARTASVTALRAHRATITGRPAPAGGTTPVPPPWVQRLTRESWLDQAEVEGARVVRRGKNWSRRATLRPSHVVHVDGESDMKNGRWRTVSRATNDARLRCFAVLREDGSLEIALHGREIIIPAPPEGWRWSLRDHEVILDSCEPCSPQVAEPHHLLSGGGIAALMVTA